MTTIATSCISGIPTEILETILDFLHDDHTALCAASLVGREWVYTPRHHLFGRLIIKETYREDGRLIIDNARTFLALAQSDHCTILTAIRTAVLVISTAELINRVVGLLAQLQTLFKLIYMPYSPSDAVSWSGDALTNICELVLNFNQEEFTDDTWRLATSFHNLRALSLYTEGGSTITLSPLPIAHFRNLHTLRLGMKPTSPLLRWLNSLAGARVPLETLDLMLYTQCHSGWGSVSALNPILKGLSDTLTNLSLIVGFTLLSSLNSDLTLEPRRSVDLGGDLDLSGLVHLRSLFLRTHDVGAACNALGTLPNPCALRALTLHAPSWPFRGECTCDMPALMHRLYGVLKGRRFAWTKAFELGVPKECDLNVAADALRRRRAKTKRAWRIGYATLRYHQCDTYYK